MNIYLRVVITIAILAGAFGFAIPSLISAVDTLFVIAGYLAVAIVPYIIYLLWSDCLGKVPTTQEENGEEDIDAPKS